MKSKDKISLTLTLTLTLITLTGEIKTKTRTRTSGPRQTQGKDEHNSDKLYLCRNIYGQPKQAKPTVEHASTCKATHSSVSHKYTSTKGRVGGRGKGGEGVNPYSEERQKQM